MNVKFESIDIQGFRSLDQVHVNLASQGTVIVKGINEYEDKATSNGSGKSSIFEAIIFALFEETSSGEKDVENRILGNGYSVVLKFNIDGDNYTVAREGKAGKSSVILYKNDEDISARTKTDTNKLIVNLLGITKNIFLDSIFLSQNAVTNLASLQPTARKERLEILTNTDASVASFKDRIKEVQLQYESKCVECKSRQNQLFGNKESILSHKADLESKVNSIQLEIERLKQLGNISEIEENISKELEQIKQYEQNIAKQDEDVELIEAEIDNMRKDGQDNLNIKNELDTLASNKLAESNVKEKEILNYSNDIAFSNKTIERILKEIEEIKNSDKCPTCGRQYDDANESHIQNTVAQKTKLIDEENLKIESSTKLVQEKSQEKDIIIEESKKISDQIAEVRRKIDESAQKIQKKEISRKDALKVKSDLYSNILSCQANINKLQSQKEMILKAETTNLKEYQDMINKAVLDIQDIDKELESLSNAYSTYDTKVAAAKHILQLVTKEFRTYLLQNSLKYMNKLLAEYSCKLFSNNEDIIQIEESDARLDIKLGSATYESLSGGEKTRVNIALLLAQKSLANMIGNISCNIIILDEILGYCDSQAECNVIELITQELESLESIYMVSHKEIPIRI